MSRCAIPLAVLLLGVAASVTAQDPVPTAVRLDSLPVLTELARQGFEVAGIERADGELHAMVYATPAQRLALAAGGLVTEAPLLAPPAPPVHFPDLATIEARLSALALAGRVVVDTIGNSWEGRPIVAVKIGVLDDAVARPNVLFLGMHHAREWISTAVVVRLIEYLSGTPAEASLLAQRDVWVIPVVNPDGYAYSIDVSRFWRKNRRLNVDGTFGVDLNRNYPGFWGIDDLGSSAVAGAETYRGTGPASEPETQAVIAFHAQHTPDVAVSYHSYSNLVLYPYSHGSGALAPDQARFGEAAGTALAPTITDGLVGSARPDYFPAPGWQLYPTNGDYTEWAYRMHGTAAFTVELTAGCCLAGLSYGFAFPDDSAAVETVFADNLPFAIEAIALAGTAVPSSPIWESLWPEIRLVTAPSASPTLSVGGMPVTPVADTLDRSPSAWRWRAPAVSGGVGTQVEGVGMAAPLTIVALDGAEGGSAWSGWARDSVGALEGTWFWRGFADTLRSRSIPLAGVAAPQATFWVRHAGSLFLPDQFAVIEMSADGAQTWMPIARLEGAAPTWYPVTVLLPETPAVRFRVRTHEMSVDIDAVHVYGVTSAPAFSVAEGELGVSENPVRSGRVFLTWTPGQGDARVSVFTFAGLPVFRTTVPASDGQFGWDLTDAEGTTVPTGAYAVAVEVGGETLRRRLFVVRAQ